MDGKFTWQDMDVRPDFLRSRNRKNMNNGQTRSGCISCEATSVMNILVYSNILDNIYEWDEQSPEAVYGFGRKVRASQGRMPDNVRWR